MRLALNGIGNLKAERLTMIFLEHLNVRVVWEAVFANTIEQLAIFLDKACWMESFVPGKVSGLPS
jgi:hypothetical protein